MEMWQSNNVSLVWSHTSKTFLQLLCFPAHGWETPKFSARVLSLFLHLDNIAFCGFFSEKELFFPEGHSCRQNRSNTHCLHLQCHKSKNWATCVISLQTPDTFQIFDKQKKTNGRKTIKKLLFSALIFNAGMPSLCELSRQVSSHM